MHCQYTKVRQNYFPFEQLSALVYSAMAETLELIKALSQELQEQILKEYIKIKLKEREELGWGKVNETINNAPFCESNQQIVKCLFCPKCEECGRNNQCNLCKRNGVNHFFEFPSYWDIKQEVDESCYRSWYNSWMGRDYSPWDDIIAAAAEKFATPPNYSIPI